MPTKRRNPRRRQTKRRKKRGGMTPEQRAKYEAFKRNTEGKTVKTVKTVKTGKKQETRREREKRWQKIYKANEWKLAKDGVIPVDSLSMNTHVSALPTEIPKFPLADSGAGGGPTAPPSSPAAPPAPPSSPAAPPPAPPSSPAAPPPSTELPQA